VKIIESLAQVAIKKSNSTLYENLIRIIAFGPCKSGKSTLLNAIIGSNILPISSEEGKGTRDMYIIQN